MLFRSKTLFGRDLLDDLKSELTGKFEKLIVALMKPSRLYDAYELKHALKGSGTDEKVLTEIIASRTPEELRAIEQVYEEGKCFELYFPSFLLSLFHFSKVNAVL